jgi:DNA-binding CsgD family transcriptional regulator
MDDWAGHEQSIAVEAADWQGLKPRREAGAPLSYRIDVRSCLLGIESNRSRLPACLPDDGHLVVEEGVLLPLADSLRPGWLAALAHVFSTRTGRLFVFEPSPRWRVAAIVPTDDSHVAIVRVTKAALHDGASIVAVARMLNLTPREAEVFGLLLDGIPPKRIAQILSTSITTVRTQVQAILAKSGHASMRELMWMMARVPSVEQLSILPVLPVPMAAVPGRSRTLAGQAGIA